MEQQPERLSDQNTRADFQFRKIIINIAFFVAIVITVIASTAFPLPTFAANCTRCGHAIDSDNICHNSLCPDSGIQCVNHQTGASFDLTSAVMTTDSNNINRALFCVVTAASVTASHSNVVEQSDGQAPPWLINLSREVTRDEDNQPNIGEALSQQNIDRPRLSFRDSETAATTLQRLLEIRQQHFIISYYFSAGEENIELHLAVAVDHSGTIFVLSSYGADWSDITQVDSDDIIDGLGLSNEGFDPSRERMIVNHLARTTPRIVPIVLQPVIEEDESNLAE